MRRLAAQPKRRAGQASHLDAVQMNLAEEALEPAMRRGSLGSACDTLMNPLGLSCVRARV